MGSPLRSRQITSCARVDRIRRGSSSLPLTPRDATAPPSSRAPSGTSRRRWPKGISERPSKSPPGISTGGPPLFSLGPMSTTRRVQGAGLSLFVTEAGDPGRPTILLVHGFPDTSAVWDPVVDRLTDSFHVVRYDVRGAGLSDVPPRRCGVCAVVPRRRHGRGGHGHEPRLPRPPGRARLGFGPGLGSGDHAGAGRPLRELHVDLRPTARSRRIVGSSTPHPATRRPLAHGPPGPALVVHRVLPPSPAARADGTKPEGDRPVGEGAASDGRVARRPLAGTELRRRLLRTASSSTAPTCGVASCTPRRGTRTCRSSS